MPEDAARAADGYAEWKGWTPDGFALPRPGDAHYFAREVREAERGTPISNVLEVGFGNGQFLAFCRSRGWNVTGTELLPELVDAARGAGYSAIEASEMDSLPDAHFDLVAAFDVLEHIPPDHAVDFLRSLASKLRPDGTMVLRFPNADSWIGNPFQFGDVTHVNAIGALKMEYYAGETGLTIERMRGGTRRGFRTSVVHGIHMITAGVIVKVGAGIAKALYFPGLRVVLSSSAVVVVLRKTQVSDV